MNAKADISLDPSLFETSFNGYVQKMEGSNVTDGEETKSALKLIVRLDTRDMDKVLSHIVPVTELKKHNVSSITEYIEAKGALEKGTTNFAAHYKDHQVKLRISGRNVAIFANCEISAFKFDLEHTFIKCHILAKGCEGESVGKVFDVLDRACEIVCARGKHWKEQDEMDLGAESDDKGDADKQTDLTQEQKQTVERNKDKANKTNTDKANNRRGTAKNPKGGRN